MLPDPETHRPCLKCTEWVDKTQGEFVYPSSGRPFGGLKQRIDVEIGDESDMRFICDRCLQRAHTRNIVIYGGLAVLVVAILLAEWMGWID